MLTRDTELVEVLTRRVRALSAEQVAEVFCRGESGSADRLLSGLEGEGLIERKALLVRPLLTSLRPIISWTPGDETPDFGKAAYRLKTRWREPVRPSEIVVATRTAATRFGGYLGGRFPRASEATHDLNLAAVFLWHREFAPEDAAAWVPEAQLYVEGHGKNGRLPDATIRRGGQDVRYVEFGGSYGKQKLLDFHAHLSELPYEIW